MTRKVEVKAVCLLFILLELNYTIFAKCTINYLFIVTALFGTFSTDILRNTFHNGKVAQNLILQK